MRDHRMITASFLLICVFWLLPGGADAECSRLADLASRHWSQCGDERTTAF